MLSLKYLFLLISVLFLMILSGCSMYCAERFYAVSSNDEAVKHLDPVSSKDDRGISFDDLTIHISSENSSTKGYSVGPWLLAIIPMPPNESNTDENIMLSIIIENKGRGYTLNLKNLKLILPNGKEIHPIRFFYGTEYPQKEGEALWLIDNEYQKASVSFDIHKKGISNFEVDLRDVFLDKETRSLPTIHFQEKVRKYMNLLP